MRVYLDNRWVKEKGVEMAEEEKKLRVYCETSFWSFLNGRPTPLSHIAIKQAATLQWWQEIAPKCMLFVS